MPDDTVQKSINDDPLASLNPSGASSVKSLGGREWIPPGWDDKEGDGSRIKSGMTISEPGMTGHETAPPLFEVENTPLAVEKPPSVETISTLESKQQVIEEAQKFKAQIPKKAIDSPSNIVNEATGEEKTHPLKTPDTLTTIADADEEEFIGNVEHHAHVRK